MPIAPIALGDKDARAKMNLLIDEVNGLDGRFSGEAAARQAAILALPLPMPVQHRPGDAPLDFGQALPEGEAMAAPLAEALLRYDDAGKVVRLAGDNLVAPRHLYAVEPGRRYLATFVVQRRVNSPDPDNDAIRCALAWYGQGKGRLVSTPQTIAQDLLGLTTGSGRQVVRAVVSRAAGADIDIVAPAGARYVRPYVETFGTLVQSDVEVINWLDITDAVAFAPDVSALEDRVGALESLDPGDRLTALESQVTAPNEYRVATIGDLEAAIIPVIVDTIYVLGYYEAGGLGGHRRAAVAVGDVQLDDRQSLDGRWWRVSEARPEIRMFGAVGDDVAIDTVPTQKAVNFCAGATLHVGPGRFLLDGDTAHAAVNLPVEGIRFAGAGKYLAAFVVAAATDAAMFVGIDADKIEFDGVGFDGQATTRVAWQRALVLRGVEDVSLTNSWFHRIGDGGVLFGREGFGGSDAYGEGTRQPKRIMVRGCEWSDCRGTVGLLSKFTGAQDFQVIGNRFRDSCSIAVSIESEDGGADPARRTIISNNIITGCSYLFTGGLSPIAYGISLGELVEGVACEGNVIDGVVGDTLAAGILVSTSPSQTDTLTKRMLVSSNTITGVTGVSGRGYGVLTQAGDTSVESIAILGNVIWDCEVGIAFEPDSGAKTTGNIQGIVCQGNIIDSCTEFGIWSNTLSGSGALPLLDAVIAGNIVRACGSHGISLKMRRGSLLGNVSSGNTGVGIGLVSGSSNVVVNANTTALNGSDGIQLNGDDLQITGNRSRNNGQVGGGTNYGIYVVTGARSEIIANDSGDDQGIPTQDYGIRAVNGSTIRNNKLIGNAAGTIFGGIGNHNTGTYDAGLNRTA